MHLDLTTWCGLGLVVFLGCSRLDRTTFTERYDEEGGPETAGAVSNAEGAPVRVNGEPSTPSPGAVPIALVDAGQEPGAAAPSDETDTDEQAPPLFPANWCGRAGELSADQEDTVYDIVDEYVLDARVAAQPPTLDAPEFGDWYDYLSEYTSALIGCPPLRVDSFNLSLQGLGLLHTEAVGLPEQPFDPVIAGALIDAFVDAMSVELDLSASEAAALRDYLWQLAPPDGCSSDADAGSACPAPDAGSP